jgi:predicted MPP superfamily phosphohydrolase
MTAAIESASSSAAAATRPSRRRFLKSATRGLLGVGAAAALYAWRIEPHWLEFTHHEMTVPNLPAELMGTTLVQISDVHVGRVDPDYVIDAFRRVAAFEPDWIVFTGDFMSCRGAEQIDETARVFESLPTARLGRAACLGNHDYGTNFRHAAVADALTRRMGDLGITVLANASRDFGGLTLIGLDDYWSPRFRPAPVMEQVDHSKANLVLCHNPDVADLPVWAGYRGWILSGHTHGGQCKPPFLPPPLLPVFNKNYTSGTFDVGEGRTMYINRALGHLTRVRFNVRPEIAVFRLG